MKHEHAPTEVDSKATTAVVKKNRAINISPETAANITLGSIISCAIALVVGTIFVWTIKTNGEQALAEIKAVREELTPAIKKLDRLWWEHEPRSVANDKSKDKDVTP